MFFFFTKKKHLKLLYFFDKLLEEYFNSINPRRLDELKMEINILLPKVKQIVMDAGRYQRLSSQNAQPKFSNVCPFDNLFVELPMNSFIPDVPNMVQQTIGLYDSG